MCRAAHRLPDLEQTTSCASHLRKWDESEVKVAQSCPTLCDPIDHTVHGILQARILEWVTIPFSRGSSQPRDQPQVSHIAGRFFTSWATREAPKEMGWQELITGTSSPLGKTKYRTRCQRALKTTEPDKCEGFFWANNDITDREVLTALENKGPVSLPASPQERQSLISRHISAPVKPSVYRVCQS